MVMHAEDQVQNDKSPKSNRTGIPDHLKLKMETSSGFSLDDVRVHYDSDEPKKIKALAYTQGSEIYIAPGQAKHLAHELGHVVQQKQGRVKPTDSVNGKVINDSPALEDEASVLMQGTALTEDSSAPKADVSLTGEQPIQMMKEEEKGSIFDIGKLKSQISELIKEINNDPKQKGWPLTVPKDDVLTQYAIRVQELLEDIRQVDLQFLAATALSYEDDTREATKNEKNALTKKEEQLFSIPKAENETQEQQVKREADQEKLREEQQKNKGILLEKLEYIKSIHFKIKEKLSNTKYEYDVAFGNFARAKKEAVVKRFEKIKNQKKAIYESEKQTSTPYLKDLEDQIEIIENTITNSGQKGYVFNQNALLTKINGKIKLYMAVVAPSKERKDVTEEKDQIKTSGNMHQWGVSTPVRAFSWLTKYLMDKSAVSNTAPVIRTLSANPDAIKELQQSAVSESFKDKTSTAPQNEDFKVPDQYGMAPGSEAFNKLIASKPKLQSVAQEEIMPDELLEGAGDVQSYDDFKMDIGFSRMKDDKTQATDVHFFDKEHTAFHEVKTNDTPSLYSPKAAKANYEKYNKKMDDFIHLLGKSDYVKKAETDQIIGAKDPNDIAVRTELKLLLEANHCLPPDAKNDLYGNSTSAKKSEQDFALKHISGADESLDSLMNIAELRYKKWASDLLTKKTVKQQTERGKLIDAIGIKLEVELLEKQLNKEGKSLNSEKLFETTTSVEEYFKGLRALDKTDPEIKLRITAFCFKLLRTIMDTNLDKLGENIEHDTTEDKLFSKRESGDYYDVLNRKEHKIIPVNADNPKLKEMLVPYDKLTSKGRFKPSGDKTKKEQIPFVGGASGTTRDMSRDLLEKGNWLDDEKDYWNFQLMNAAFMITYDYHSFVEVLFRAATTRLGYGVNNTISQKIYDYLKLIADDKNEDVTNETIIETIKKLI